MRRRVKVSFRSGTVCFNCKIVEFLSCFSSNTTNGNPAYNEQNHIRNLTDAKEM